MESLSESSDIGVALVFNSGAKIGDGETDSPYAETSRSPAARPGILFVRRLVSTGDDRWVADAHRPGGRRVSPKDQERRFDRRASSSPRDVRRRGVENKVAGVRRYEEGYIRYTAEDIEEVRSVVAEVVTWVGSIVHQEG